MADSFLDKSGLSYLWSKIKQYFVEKETGKGLSTNDYTTAEKNKLSGIATGAEVNVQSDWNITDTSSDAYIKNKPYIMPAVSKTVNVNASSAYTPNASTGKLAKCEMRKAIGQRTDGKTTFTAAVGLYSGESGIITKTYTINFPDKFYAGRVNVKTGEVIDTWMGVDLGTLSWSVLSQTTSVFVATLSGRRYGEDEDIYGNCAGYTWYANTSVTGLRGLPNNNFGYRATNTQIAFRDDRYTTAAAFKAAISGTYLIYELAEEATRTIDPVDIRLYDGNDSTFFNQDSPSGTTWSIEYIVKDYQAIIDALS